MRNTIAGTVLAFSFAFFCVVSIYKLGHENGYEQGRRDGVVSMRKEAIGRGFASYELYSSSDDYGVSKTIFEWNPSVKEEEKK